MSHCGAFERVSRRLRRPRATATRGQMRFGVSGHSHHDTTWWRPTARADGAKVSRSRANGTQATEVDSVGVHALAAENVRTRDLDVDPTMRFLRRK